MRLPRETGGEGWIDVGAMRREVAMREGEARRFATWKVQPCAAIPNLVGLQPSDPRLLGRVVKCIIHQFLSV